jgi:hypothetical protein
VRLTGGPQSTLTGQRLTRPSLGFSGPGQGRTWAGLGRAGPGHVSGCSAATSPSWALTRPWSMAGGLRWTHSSGLWSAGSALGGLRPPSSSFLRFSAHRKHQCLQLDPSSSALTCIRPPMVSPAPRCFSGSEGRRESAMAS